MFFVIVCVCAKVQLHLHKSVDHMCICRLAKLECSKMCIIIIYCSKLDLSNICLLKSGIFLLCRVSIIMSFQWA